MKRAKIFMSVVVASTLIFGLSSHLFAESEKNINADSQLIDQNDDKNPDDSQKSEHTKTLNIKFKEYVDQNDRFLGSYPDIEDMKDLSSKIYNDIESAITDLNLNNSDNVVDSIIKVKIDENDDFAKIDIAIEFEDNETDLVYYIDKKLMKEISQTEYEKTQKDKDEDKDKEQEIDGKKIEEEEKDQTESTEITMVPLRANAESLGWKVEWLSKTADYPACAVLTKGQTKIAVLYNSTFAYDLIITNDINLNDITTDSLERSAELIDDKALYVPSSFVKKYLDTEKMSDKTEQTTSNQKVDEVSTKNKN